MGACLILVEGYIQSSPEQVTRLMAHPGHALVPIYQ
jgi:hypothetical protein